MGHDFEAWENGLQAPLVVFERLFAEDLLGPLASELPS